MVGHDICARFLVRDHHTPEWLAYFTFSIFTCVKSNVPYITLYASDSYLEYPHISKQVLRSNGVCTISCEINKYGVFQMYENSVFYRSL